MLCPQPGPASMSPSEITNVLLLEQIFVGVATDRSTQGNFHHRKIYRGKRSRLTAKLPHFSTKLSCLHKEMSDAEDVFLINEPLFECHNDPSFECFNDPTFECTNDTTAKCPSFECLNPSINCYNDPLFECYTGG